MRTSRSYKIRALVQSSSRTVMAQLRMKKMTDDERIIQKLTVTKRAQWWKISGASGKRDCCQNVKE